MGKRWARGQFCDLIPARFKDTIFGVCLKDSCYQHDMHYIDKDVSRKEADLEWFNEAMWEFTKCDKRKLGYFICIPAYLILRLFGWIRW